MKKLEIVGQRFGRLVVTKCAGPANGCLRWTCLCDCGNVATVYGSSLKTGNTKSCGCLRDESRKTVKTTHGLSGKRTYYVWKDIKRRCYDETRPEYKNYGGRGIVMCDEWKEDVVSFCKWADENGYKKGMTIDRIDNNSNYEPSNCAFKTMKEQANNTRKNRMVTIGEDTKTVSEWSDVSGIPYETLYARVRKGLKESNVIGPVAEKFRHKKIEVTNDRT